MNIKKIFSIITYMPNCVNYLFLTLNNYPKLIFGKKYSSIYSNFFKHDCSTDVVNLFNHSIKRVPFYKKQYFNKNIKNIADFKRFVGFIDKDIVANNFYSILASNEIFNSYDSCTTGGTSGKPLKIMLPKNRYSYEIGSLYALWSKIGFSASARAVVRNERIKDRDFIINPVTKEFIFDGFRTDEKYLELIYEVMKKYNLNFFHGYTSNAERFVNYIISSNKDYSFLKGIITTSENFYEHQKHTFKKLKNVRHMNFYGHSEKLILAGWCEEGGCYHFYNSYGYAELLDSEGNDIKEVGAIGELVGSTSYNAGMPLFRYRTGDFAVKGPEICSGCGFKGLSAYTILGRWNGDRIYNKDGSYVTTTAINLHSSLYEHIEGLQYYQPKLGHLTIRVIPSKGFNNQIEKDLIHDVKTKMHSDAEISIERVALIEKKANGKYLLLISDLK